MLFQLFVITNLFLLAAGQPCTIPAPLNNNNTFHLTGSSQNGTITATGSDSLVITLGTTTGTYSCDGSAPSTTGVGTEYFGRYKIPVSVFMVQVGMCFRFSPQLPTSSSVIGLTFRSNVSTVGGSTANMVKNGVGNPTTQAASCDAGGLRPEFEIALVDFTSGSFTPLTCPGALRSTFASFTLGGVACGSRGATGSGSSFSVDFTSCAQAALFFATGGSNLVCLHSFTRGSVDFLLLASGTSISASYYCAAYSTGNGTLLMTMTKDTCDAQQTSTSVGSTSASSFLAFAFSNTTIPSDAPLQHSNPMTTMLLFTMTSLLWQLGMHVLA